MPFLIRTPQFREGLKRFQPILADAYLSARRDSVIGHFEGYDAEFGFFDLSHARFFCRIKLKEKMKIPFIFWDKLNLQDNIELHFEKWVTYTHTSLTSAGCAQYVSYQTNTSMREQFSNLFEITKKIESGEISLENIIDRERKEFIKGWLIVILISSIIIYALYHYFIR